MDQLSLELVRFMASVKHSQSRDPHAEAARKHKILCCLGTSHCCPGQSSCRIPVWAKSHCCLRTCSRFGWSGIKGKEEVKLRTRPASPGWTTRLAVMRKHVSAAKQIWAGTSEELPGCLWSFLRKGSAHAQIIQFSWFLYNHCSDFSECVIFSLIDHCQELFCYTRVVYLLL